MNKEAMIKKPLVLKIYIGFLLGYLSLLLIMALYFLFLIITVSIKESFVDLAIMPVIIFFVILLPTTFYLMSTYCIIKCRNIGRLLMLYGVIPISVYAYLAINKPRFFVIPQLLIMLLSLIILNLPKVRNYFTK
jgi:hypothetical protein